MRNDIFIKRIVSRKEIQRVEKKIMMLGPNTKYELYHYLNLKLITLFFIYLLLLFGKFGFFVAPVTIFGLYFFYDYVFLTIPIKKRANILEHDAIFFFEVLVLTLQSENNLKLCLETTSNAIDSEISSEIKEMLKEMKLGKSLTEALEDLRMRMPSKTVNNVILNLIETSEYGNSIIDALNNQIEYITDKRILEIKGQINKMPTKISIVSVCIFIPLVLLLIIGPIIIKYGVLFTK